MKEVILVCNAGMSSSLMAKKVSEKLINDGYEINVTATTTGESDRIFKSNKYKLILISPQVRMLYDKFAELAEKNGMNIAQIPFDAYSPTSSGVTKLEKIVIDNLD